MWGHELIARGVDNLFKRFTAAFIAASMVAAPTIAAAQTAAPTEVAPSSETVEGSEIRGGFLLPLAVIVAIIIGVLLLTNDDEDPVSP